MIVLFLLIKYSSVLNLVKPLHKFHIIKMIMLNLLQLTYHK